VNTLSSVSHIPDLKCNRISVLTLESNKCRYSTEGGVLKVFKSAWVLLKGLRIVQGCTMIDSAAVTSNLSYVNLTRLWHVRLDHMRNKAMTN